MKSISAGIFAYNEAQSLETVVREVQTVLSKTGRKYEIVIIDDGSTDTGPEIADRLAGQLDGVRVIHHDSNYGLGSAYKTGFLSLKNDLVTFFSADGQFPAEIIDRFLPLMDTNDMVLGFISDRNDPLFSKLLSAVERFLFYILFGPMPKFQGMLMFKRELLEKFALKSPGGRSWMILMEFIIRVKKSGARLTSIPFKARSRMAGVSKVNNLRTIWANFKQLMLLKVYL